MRSESTFKRVLSHAKARSREEKSYINIQDKISLPNPVYLVHRCKIKVLWFSFKTCFFLRGFAPSREQKIFLPCNEKVLL